jgi:membrane protease YdiL (CAAX protease family)
LARSALVALTITFLPQGIWSALIGLNLRVTPRIPWAVAAVVVAVWLIARYLQTRRRSADEPGNRHRPPRASVVSRPVLLWSWLAGGCSLIALVGYWIVLASFVGMPGSVLPDLSGYPWWTAALAIVTGAAISPLCEQAGLWGYWQVELERQFSGRTAILVTAITFAVLPHPPAHAALWAKWFFFFLTGLMFSTMAFVTDSILPGLTVHAVSLLTFFVLVWPYDAHRSLVTDAGTNVWLWAHLAQAALFSILACWAFRRLRQVSGSATSQLEVRR